MKDNGRILRLSGGLYTVQTESGPVACHAKGAFRNEKQRPVVGDEVSIERIGEGEGAVICEILPRKNLLIRPPLSNLDTIFLVCSVKSPDPVLLSMDKLLSIAVHNRIRAVPVFTKKELSPEKAEELTAIYRDAGFDAVAVSRLDEEETRSLLYPLIQGKICAMAGASGVGKSTLIHTLFPFLNPETGSVSDKTRRGKHTTRETTLYDVSSLLGRDHPIYLADTPGFSLLDFERFFFMEKEDLAFSFPEFQCHLAKCKYSKCSHRTEDGCSILQAVESGAIPRSRHESYVSLYEELSRTKPWEVGKKKTYR